MKMNEYNFLIDGSFRQTFVSSSEAQAIKDVKQLYPDLKSYDLMAIIIK